MRVGFSFSHFSSLLLVVALICLCLSGDNFNDALCKDDERQALVEFKHNLIDEANRLASWPKNTKNAQVKDKSPCCAIEVPDRDHEEDNSGSQGADWGLIISIVSGFIAGFWAVLTPLMMVSTQHHMEDCIFWFLE